MGSGQIKTVDMFKAPPIGTRLKMLGVNKSFFTKPRNKCRIKQFQEAMWKVRNGKVVDINTWNEAALVYGHIPLWTESVDTDITLGADQDDS